MRRLIVVGCLSAILVALGSCSYQAQQCCECMETKDTIFGECVMDEMSVCVEKLSKDPPDVDAISELCRGDEENGYCTDSCADILYRN